VNQDVLITAGAWQFTARLEDETAPRTCAAFRRLMPFTNRLVHVRWSGEAVWVPLGDLSLDIGSENATSYPAPGQVIVYPGGISETEILIAYGACCFASKAGQLAGNHFLTIVSGTERLRELGVTALWQGAQPITIELRM
jgi:Protein of unknown function (DUF3830)